MSNSNINYRQHTANVSGTSHRVMKGLMKGEMKAISLLECTAYAMQVIYMRQDKLHKGIWVVVISQVQVQSSHISGSDVT